MATDTDSKSAASGLPSANGSVIQWRKAPSNGGEGTAGKDRWWDGDLLLCIVETNSGNDIFTAHVSADEGGVSLLDRLGDLIDWSVADLAYYAKIEDSILPNTEIAHSEQND